MGNILPLDMALWVLRSLSPYKNSENNKSVNQFSKDKTQPSITHPMQVMTGGERGDTITGAPPPQPLHIALYLYHYNLDQNTYFAVNVYIPLAFDLEPSFAPPGFNQ